MPKNPAVALESASVEPWEAVPDVLDVDESLLPVGLIDDVYALGEPDRAAAEPSPEEAAIGTAEQKMAADAFDRLSLREQQVLAARPARNEDEMMTLKAIGDELGVTAERVRQIERDALQKLMESYLDIEQATRWSPQQLMLQAQWTAWRREHVSRFGRPDQQFPPVPPKAPSAEQTEAVESWRRELIEKQERGEIAFVQGSLLVRALPMQIVEYLETGRFEGERDGAALRLAHRAGKAESDPELQREIALERAHEEVKSALETANRAHTKMRTLEGKLEEAKTEFEDLSAEGAEALERARIAEEAVQALERD